MTLKEQLCILEKVRAQPVCQAELFFRDAGIACLTDNVFDPMVQRDELVRSFCTNAPYTRDSVHTVTHKCEHVNKLVWGQAYVKSRIEPQ